MRDVHDRHEHTETGTIKTHCSCTTVTIQLELDNREVCSLCRCADIPQPDQVTPGHRLHASAMCPTGALAISLVVQRSGLDEVRVHWAAAKQRMAGQQGGTGQPSKGSTADAEINPLASAQLLADYAAFFSQRFLGLGQDVPGQEAARGQRPRNLLYTSVGNLKAYLHLLQIMLVSVDEHCTPNPDFDVSAGAVVAVTNAPNVLALASHCCTPERTDSKASA